MYICESRAIKEKLFRHMELSRIVMPLVLLLLLFCLRFQANICMYVCIKSNDEEQKKLFMGQKHLHVLYTEY